MPLTFPIMKLLKPFDSVFTPHLTLFADSVEVPNANDDSILPDKQINGFFDGYGDSFSQAMGDLVKSEVLRMIDELGDADATKLNKYQWKVQRPLEDLLWGLWSGGWESAQDYATQELERVIVQQNAAQMSFGFDLAEFDRRMNRRFKPDVKLGMPSQMIGRRKPPESIGRIVPLRKTYLERAIRDRVALLSEDVSSDLIEEFKDHLRAWKGIEPQNPNYNAQWGSGQINKTTMYDRVQQSIEGDQNEDYRNRRAGVYGRARTIGVTEASGVYSLGKLHSYLDLENASGGKYRIRKVRYQTKEYAFPRPDKQRPCMKCIPKNGHLLDLQTQWQLIMTTYLIPAHGSCRCFWLPVLEKSDEEGKFLTMLSRVASGAAGERLSENWVGLAVDELGRIFMPEAAQAEARKRMARASLSKQRERIIRAGTAAAVTLSFGGLLYQFFQHWNQQRTQQTTGGTTVAPDDVERVMRDIVGQAIEQEFTPQQTPLSQILNPQRVTAIAGSNLDLNRVSVKYLQSLGMDGANAQRAQALLKQYVGWLNSQPRVTLGGVNLNTASVQDLVASRLFSLAEARAIAAYTQGNVMTSVFDLSKVVDAKARPVFTKAQVNRYASYYLKTNVNDPNLKTPLDLTTRFRLTQRQAERVLATRDAGQFANAAEMERRLVEAIKAEGKSDAYAKKEARRIVQTLQAQGGRVDGVQQDPLPRLEMLEMERILLPGQQLTSTTATPQRVAGAPPVPVTSDPAIQQENLKAFLQSRNRPQEILKEKAIIDQMVQDKALERGGRLLQQKLQAQANQFAATQKEAARALNQYQAYTDRAQRLVNETETLLAQLDQVLQINMPELLDNSLGAIDTTLSQLTGLRSEWVQQNQQDVDLLNNSLLLDQRWINRDGEAEPPLKQQVLNQIPGAIVQDQVEGGPIAGKISWVQTNIDTYQRDLYRPEAVQAVGADINRLREEAAGLSDLKQGNDLNWNQLPVIQDIDNQVASLQRARDTLALDVYGQKARLQEAILQLQAKRNQLQQRLNRPPDLNLSRSTPLTTFRRRPRVLSLRSR